MNQFLKDIGSSAVGGVLGGLVAGVVLLEFASQIDEDLSDKQQRLENLRFVRDVSTAHVGAIPFQSLDLQGMNLSGLHFPCRDDSASEAATTTSTSAPSTTTTTSAPVGSCVLSADFTGANLTGAVMQNMDLSDAVFANADLAGADLRGSKLDRADFTKALNLDTAILVGVCYEAEPHAPGDVEIPPSAETVPPEGDDEGWDSPVCNPGYYAS